MLLMDAAGVLMTDGVGVLVRLALVGVRLLNMEEVVDENENPRALPKAIPILIRERVGVGVGVGVVTMMGKGFGLRRSLGS